MKNQPITAAFPKVFPIGAIVFTHEDAPTERVPYMSETEFVSAFRQAIEDGLDPNAVWPYVRNDRLDVAKKLFDAMQTAYGTAYDVYALTPENIGIVLGDHRVVVPAQA